MPCSRSREHAGFAIAGWVGSAVRTMDLGWSAQQTLRAESVAGGVGSGRSRQRADYCPGSDQSMGLDRCSTRNALIRENGLLPKNPRRADSGDGCGL